MTCIVGVQHKGRVWIGGDSAGVAGYAITVRADPKVFTNGPYILGFTTSFRMGQLLRYKFKPPTPVDNDLDRFMATRFIDATRDALEQGGWLTTTNGNQEGGTFLVGIKGQLYIVDSDFQIGRSALGYDAVGCGSDIALGSLHTTQGMKPRTRIRAALHAAATHSAGVTPPFVLEATR
jgi:hypothetical protein